MKTCDHHHSKSIRPHKKEVRKKGEQDKTCRFSVSLTEDTFRAVAQYVENSDEKSLGSYVRNLIISDLAKKSQETQ